MREGLPILSYHELIQKGISLKLFWFGRSKTIITKFASLKFRGDKFRNTSRPEMSQMLAFV
jgi:hypothetical protein